VDDVRTALGAAPAPPTAGPFPWITLVAVTALVGGVVAALAALTHRMTTDGSTGGASDGVPMERLTALSSLDGDPAALAAALGLDPPEHDSLYVKMAGQPFDYASFSWDAERKGHADSFTLVFGKDDAAAQAIVERLSAALGRRFVSHDGRIDLTSGTTYFYLLNPPDSPQGPPQSIAADIQGDDPLAQARLDLLWRVAMAAATGHDPVLDETARRVLLREGWPLTTIASLDPSIDIDAAGVEVPRRFPGSTSRIAGRLEWSVAVDHPWFDDIELRWSNEARAHLQSIALDPAPRAGDTGFSDQAAVRACLEAALGPGKVEEQDHLAGQWSAWWRIRGLGSVSLSATGIGIHFDSFSGTEAGPDPEAWRRLLVALDPCGRAR
jgi:hypothetical protein